MKTNKSFHVLVGSLFLGIALASAIWLLNMQRPFRISNAQARAMKYPDAATYERVTHLRDSIKRKRSASPSELTEVEALLKHPYPRVRTNGFICLRRLAASPNESGKALDLICSMRNHADPVVRQLVAANLEAFRDPRAGRIIEDLAKHDADEKVRRQAAASLKYRTARLQWQAAHTEAPPATANK